MSYLCFSVNLTIMGDSSYKTNTPGSPWSPISPLATFSCLVTENWFVFTTCEEINANKTVLDGWERWVDVCFMIQNVFLSVFWLIQTNRQKIMFQCYTFSFTVWPSDITEIPFYILHIRHHVRIRYMTYFELFWSYGFLDISIKIPTILCWSSLGLDWKRTHLSVGFHVDGGNNFHKVLVHHRRCGDRKKTLEINMVFNHLRRNRRSRWNSRI